MLQSVWKAHKKQFNHNCFTAEECGDWLIRIRSEHRNLWGNTENAKTGGAVFRVALETEEISDETE